MVNPIPPGLKKIWDNWNIRGLMLFSLFLQTFLILFAPLRKRTGHKLIIMLIWSVYLVADWAANFAVGLISDSQRDTHDNQCNSSRDPVENSYLLAFWPPFLLLHLGGPDTITAFSLEDNELWLRHLLGLVFQVVAAVYVFLQSLPQTKLAIPTLLMFLAGTIKYLERTRALYLASLDRFRDSMLKEPDPGPNYAKLMDDIASKKEANLPTMIILRGENSDEKSKASTSVEHSGEKPKPSTSVEVGENSNTDGTLDDVKVVHYAYHFFEIFKGLIVDLIFSFQERNESRKFFHKLSAEDALRVIEVELNFIYEALYTKVQVVHSKFGYCTRFVSFASVVASLSFFYFKVKKSGFHEIDVVITYALFWGAIALDTVAFFMLIFSDWTFAVLYDPKNGSKMPRKYIAATIGWFLIFKRPRCYEHKKRSCKLLATPFLLRRWSGDVPGHNLIKYCLKGHPHNFHKVRADVYPFTKKFIPAFIRGEDNLFIGLISNGASQFLGFFYGKATHLINKVIDCFGLTDFMDEIRYVSHEPLTEELWEFIFTELRDKSINAEDPEVAKQISSARGNWILEGSGRYPTLEPYLTKVTYDESLLLWHIATELLYHTEVNEDIEKGENEDTKLKHHTEEEVTRDNNKDNGPDLLYHTGVNEDIEKGENEDTKLKHHTEEEVTRDNNKDTKLKHREFSKLLSDYMLYLLVMHPTMMSVEAGIGKIRFRDTCAEANRLFTSKDLGPNEEEEACQEIFDVNLYVEPVTKVKGDRSKSVLFDASKLAQVLNEMDDIEIKGKKVNKWELLSKIWVEMLSYAACNCIARTQAQQVSKGGELISFVWLLMAHFGIGRQFQINKGHAITKLIVGK
ncbi:hypothetical protein Dsin_023437 [Dipteronia sinensis]|uniref:DUF4220 domain-containing protein n=1 Tax=Dipteronia sinensis TaxID=43782 RepID=A0AAE0E232_9ROSI|nr:hypothetical protein Dsin_023437 [Dipteronia sinensis]